MKELEQKISQCGSVLPGDVLKVGSFLNHQMDVDFLCTLGKEFYRLYGQCGVTKILTVESSGIGIACLTAQYFHVPVVFAKKSRTSNLSGDVFLSSVTSYTRGTTSDLMIPREYLLPEDRILIIDDFLATGSALIALCDLVCQSGALLVGCGIEVEKAYQNGGRLLRERGIRVESLARIASMDEQDGIRFC